MTSSNNGPLDADEYNEPLNELEAHLNELLDADLNEATAGKLNDVVKEIQVLIKNADKDRTEIKRPYLEGGKRVDADFKPITERGKDLAARGKAKVTQYMVEQARIANEIRREAEAKAAEAARIAEQLADDVLVGESVVEDAKRAARSLQVAQAEENDAGRVGSLSGQSRVMSLRTSYEAEITDASAAAVHYADHPKVRDAILMVANAALRSANKPEGIPGIKIHTVQKAA